ncbi:MAG: efflux RND transporter periplasmic adaptor subunit [Planctomycetes bacterium]|nr:efflux RND transporter periplasmic adaptor subunit [Planctomycetota bacterium]
MSITQNGAGEARLPTPGKRRFLMIGLGIVGVIALGASLWFAYNRGWLGGRADTNQSAEMEDMPGKAGMKMPKRGSQADMKSDLPGYAKVNVNSGVQQRIGVKIGKVEEAPLEMSVRAVGIIRPNEAKLTRVHLRTEGWVEKLYVNFTGQEVKEGEPLLAIYSPQFLTTQQEYLSALESKNQNLADLAKRRLQLWGVSDQELEKLQASKKALTNLVLRASLNGSVLTKNVLKGEFVTSQTELYTIADLSTVWAQAKVYEYELPHVQLGQPATVTVPGLPDKTFAGKVVFIQPTVDEATRTVQVRVELANKERVFKPGMFVHFEIKHEMGKGLLVPTSAVLRTGEKDIVFRTEADDLFVPVEVKISPIKFGDRFQVLKGLKAGDQVVTSGNFLIDSESRLHAGGMGAMPGMKDMDMKDMKEMNHSKMKH